MFTFSICTYNHSKYIIEHLESIKFIVEHYNYSNKISLLICDDHSTDNTLDKVNFWLENNNKLFKNIKIIKNSRNLGTVNNFINLIKNIETNYFKLVAGDDLYNYRDVVKRYSSDNFIVGFTLPFDNESYRFYKSDNYRYNRQKLFILNDDFIFYKNYVLSNNSLSGPGAGYNISWLKNKNLYEALSEYKLIEDRPLWKYLFTEVNPKVELELNPYVLHRENVGVTAKNNNVHLQYLNDLNLIDRNTYKGKSVFYKSITKVYYKALLYLCGKYSKFISGRVRNFDVKINNELDLSNKHLIKIRKLAMEIENEYKKQI